MGFKFCDCITGNIQRTAVIPNHTTGITMCQDDPIDDEDDEDDETDPLDFEDWEK